jgi:hypothetical protein
VLQIFRHNLKQGGQLLLSHQCRKHTYDFVQQVKYELGMTEIRVDTVEKDAESVFGQFSISIHHLLSSV